MKKNFLLILFGGLFVLFTIVSTEVSASPISINNPSFEVDVPEDGGWSSSGGGSGVNSGYITGWNLPGGWGGTFRPTAIPFPGGVPDGLNTAWLNGHTISQLLSETLSQGYNYTLQVYVGNRADLNFSSYGVQLLAGGNLLAQDDNSLSPPDGQFMLSTVTYTAFSDDSYLGLPLEIRLTGGGIQVNFDMVSLDASPTISPNKYFIHADFDKDGDIDASDLAKFSSVYGTFINKTPVNTSWGWDSLPTGYFCDNWENGECTVKRPDYSSTSDRISELKQGIVQPENGTIDETFINASESGAFKFTPEEIVISNLFDSQWHDVLGKNNRFNTVWSPKFPIEKLEVISQVDKRSAPSSTTNNKSYFFSYKQNTISLTDWVDYLTAITCNFSRKIDTLVIYAHGNYSNNEGLLEITGDILHTNDLQNDNDTRNTLMRLKNIMTSNGHILLFSCNTGQDQAFIKELASLSGAYVHANSNLTGHPDDEAPWFNCASNSECTDWQLDLVCPPTGDCYYE